MRLMSSHKIAPTVPGIIWILSYTQAAMNGMATLQPIAHSLSNKFSFLFFLGWKPCCMPKNEYLNLLAIARVHCLCCPKSYRAIYIILLRTYSSFTYWINPEAEKIDKLKFLLHLLLIILLLMILQVLQKACNLYNWAFRFYRNTFTSSFRL